MHQTSLAPGLLWSVKCFEIGSRWPPPPSQAWGFKKKGGGMKRKRNAEKCVSAFAERCLPNQFKMLSAQRPSHHGFSLTSEAGLLFKGLFSLRARRGLGPLQQLPVVPRLPVCQMPPHRFTDRCPWDSGPLHSIGTQQSLRFSRRLSCHSPLEECPNILVTLVTSVP